MVIRGGTRGNGKQLASYLMKQAENDNVQVLDIRGTMRTDDIHMSLLEMSLTSELTKSDKGLYHAQLSPAYGDDKKMTHEDWLRAADIVEQELGLTGQKRVIVMHDKNDRLHAHVVWERYDHDKGIMISDSFTHLAQDRARKIIEQELDHQRTPDRNTKRPEMKLELTELWQKSKTAKEFIEAATEKGYNMAVGKQRPYMVVDNTGRSFDLVRQLDKVKTKDVRERFKEQKLPTEKEAIKTVRNKQAEKTFDMKQELFLDSMGRFKQQQNAKEDYQRMAQDKFNAMKETGEGITAETEKAKREREYTERAMEKLRQQQEKKKDKGLEHE